MPSAIFCAISPHLTVLANDSSVVKRPFSDVAIASATSSQLIASLSPLMPLPSAVPSPFQLNLWANPCAIRQTIMNLFPKKFPSFVQLISSTRPFAPSASFLPRFLKSIPVFGSIRRFKALTITLTPRPTVRPIFSQWRLSTRLLTVVENASSHGFKRFAHLSGSSAL